MAADVEENLPRLGSTELFLRVGQRRSEAVGVFAEFMKRYVIGALRDRPNGL